MKTKSQPSNDVKVYEITLGPRIKVTIDPNSKARVINFPFELSDGTRAVIIICRLADEEWIPSNDIKNIILEYV